MAYKVDYWEALTYSKAQLKAMVDSRARRANQRLRELEKRDMTGSTAYRYLERHAQNMSGLRHTKNGYIRFKVGAGKNATKTELASALAQIESFLDAKTSTVKGINQAYRKSYESLLKNNNMSGSQLSFNEYTDIMEADNLNSFKKQFYSAFVAMISNKTKSVSSGEIRKIIEGSAGRTLKDIEEDDKNAGGTGWIQVSSSTELPFK